MLYHWATGTLIKQQNTEKSHLLFLTEKLQYGCFRNQAIYIFIFIFVHSVSWKLLLNTYIVPGNKALFVLLVYYIMCICNLYLCFYFLIRKIQHFLSLPTLASYYNGLLIILIHWLASSLCLLSNNKLVCGERSGALWLPSHHPGGCCTLVVVEEIPPLLYKALWVPRKALYKCNKWLLLYISAVLFSPIFCNLERFIIGKLVWLYCSDNLQNSKTNMTKNSDKIVNHYIKKKTLWY